MSKKKSILPQWVASKNLHPGWQFEGSFPISSRVSGWADAEWPESLPVKLQVDQAPGRRLCLKVALDISATLRCEHCGEPMPWGLSLEQDVLLLNSEDEQQDEAQWVMHDERLALHELLEAEISLAMPDFPRHPDC